MNDPTNDPEDGFHQGCDNPIVNNYMQQIIRRIETKTRFRVYMFGAGQLNRIDPISAACIDFKREKEDPLYHAGRKYFCYLFVEIDGSDFLVCERTKKLDTELGGLSLTSFEDGLKGSRIMESYVSDWDFANILADIVRCTVYPVGAIRQDNKKYRRFYWVVVA